MASYEKARSAQIIDDEPQGEEPKGGDKFDDLARWVLAKTDAWRNWRDGNYQAKWEEYERLWRGEWSPNESTRSSERSKVVCPALSEAVENAAAEIEEAVFGRGADYFDVEPDEQSLALEQAATPAPVAPPAGGFAPPMGAMPGMQDPMAPQAGPGAGMLPQMPPAAPEMDMESGVEDIRRSLREDLQRSDFASSAVEVILHAAVYGTGFGEIITTEKTVKVPSAQGMASEEKKFDIPTLSALSPRNVLVDPSAKKLEDGLGVAIEEEVGKHIVLRAQKEGILRDDIDVCEAQAQDDTLHGDQITGSARHEEDTVHLTRWYGLVPTKLLYPENREEGVEYEDDGDYTEAIVVIVNKRKVAKAESNPAPKADRPIVYFPWDMVPGRLHGRGICEKGASSQKILDAEVRARLDTLALVTVPMMGVDATRVPRGFKFKLQPGGSILTQGDPETVLRPFKFGQLDPNHWQNAAALQAMVHQATGSIDATALANNSGNARPGAVSMALAPVIKRYKRTLVRFFDLFLMPALDKIVTRSMQTMPERYPAVPVRLRPASVMGIMQREYETGQLSTLLASMEPGTPEHRAILLGIVSNTSIPNREGVMKIIAGAEARQAEAEAQMQAQQQNPMVQQLQQASIELELREKQAKIAKLEAEAMLAQAKAEILPVQAQVDAMATATKGMYSVPEAQQATEFDRRMAIADRVLEGEKLKEKAADRESNERITAAQLQMASTKAERDRQAKLAIEAAKLRNKAAPKPAR